MNKNIIKDSISCLENVTLEDTTYKIAINITLDYLKELEEKNKKLKDELELKDFNYTTFRHLEESNDILKEELKETEEEVDKLEDRINKAIEYIASITDVKLRYFNYSKFEKTGMNISNEELRKRVKEQKLEGFYIEVDREELLKILKGE